MTVRHYVRWLQFAAVLTIATGLVAALASHPVTAEPWRWLFDVLTWPVDGSPVGFDRLTYQVNAVLGGVMVGWGCTILLFTFDRQADPHAIARPILGGLVAWFVIDSSGSLVAEIPGNVVLNLGFLVLFVIPLVGILRSPSG